MNIDGHVALLAPVAIAAIWAVTRIVMLLIVLRGTKPGERAALVRALGELSRQPSIRSGRHRSPGDPQT